MTNLILGSALAVIYLLVFWGMGAVLPDRYQSGSVPVMCMSGFLLYFSLFQLVALPMKLRKLPLSWLTIAWGCLLLASAAYVLLRRRNVLLRSLKNAWKPGQKLLLVVFMAFLAVGVGLFLGYNVNVLSEYDAAYYIGMPNASAYSNTIGLMSPYTGTLMEEPDHFYIMNTDMFHSAVIYQALKLHPLVERKWSFTIAMAVLFEMVLYQCGKQFFEKEYGKTGVFCIFANLALFFSYSISGVSHYFSYRTYEGKSVTSYFYMAVIFCFGLALYQKPGERWPWAGLFLAGISGVAFCNTALFVVPGMICFTLFWYVGSEFFRKKNYRVLGRFALVLLPTAAWLLIYQVI